MLPVLQAKVNKHWLVWFRCSSARELLQHSWHACGEANIVCGQTAHQGGKMENPSGKVMINASISIFSSFIFAVRQQVTVSFRINCINETNHGIARHWCQYFRRGWIKRVGSILRQERWMLALVRIWCVPCCNLTSLIWDPEPSNQD